MLRSPITVPHRPWDYPTMACVLEGDGRVHKSGDFGRGSGPGTFMPASSGHPGFSAPSCVQSLPPKAIHLPVEHEGENHFLFTALRPDPGLGQTQCIKDGSWALTQVYLWGWEFTFLDQLWPFSSSTEPTVSMERKAGFMGHERAASSNVQTLNHPSWKTWIRSFSWWWFSHYVISDSLQSQGLYPTRLLCAWYSPGKNTGGGCHFLLQVIFPRSPTLQVVSWISGRFFFCLFVLMFRQILYQLSLPSWKTWIKWSFS